MAFLEVEDLYGIVEVVIFPKDYERNSQVLVEDAKVFVKGRVSLEEDKNGKLICERVIPFDEIGRKLWVRFENINALKAGEKDLMQILSGSNGPDQVILLLADTKQKKILPAQYNVKVDDLLLSHLTERFGKDNVKLI